VIRLSYTQYQKQFVCKVENLNELSVETLHKLESFAQKRSGKFDYTTESMTIPKRIELQHLQELFMLSGLDVFITELQPKKQRISDSATINFGKFKGTKWTDLEEDYLRWLSSNIKGDAKETALAELERRKTNPTKKDPKELKDKIGFGKYRGREWGDLPKDYLSWVASNLKGEASRYAEVVLSYKS
jgi:uncharacterized protein (DUF3820 family)